MLTYHFTVPTHLCLKTCSFSILEHKVYGRKKNKVLNKRDLSENRASLDCDSRTVDSISGLTTLTRRLLPLNFAI
ncbi:hypothetical protein OJAV_G00032640 [Oryzias javanicus]|uniref:Uncharacterized protein n=1 Tax=Oryzias javanicus TaxID=123683 RepID=A0A437DF46_ORYJA|nr:hypothetical protein OJAV_G00032640 [Oryzias javanicus]